MTERRHDHGAVASSINRAGSPCGGSTEGPFVAPGASWRVGFGSRIDANRTRRDFGTRPPGAALHANGVGTLTRNGAVGPKATVALRAPSASGPTAPSDCSTAAQTATDRPTTITERRQVVGDAPLLTLRRQK
jgi:hypothetical protein